jgi:hypothetical protein
MSSSGYPALAQWARPDVDEPLVGIKASSPFTYVASVFQQNINGVRALAVLPGVVAAHAYGPNVDLVVGAERVEASKQALWVWTGTDILYASVVIGTWTAFEVLAGDLWVDVVNRVPLLGVRALDAEPLPGGAEEAEERKAKKMVSVVAQRLLDPHFDLRQRMGDVLSEDFPMTKFRNIVNAYKQIFRDDAVCNIIRDTGVRSLSAVRNILVHKAGRADKDFVRQVKADARFAAVRENDMIQLDGCITAQLVESARTQGYALIRFIDEWYAAHMAVPPGTEQSKQG